MLWGICSIVKVLNPSSAKRGRRNPALTFRIAQVTNSQKDWQEARSPQKVSIREGKIRSPQKSALRDDGHPRVDRFFKSEEVGRRIEKGAQKPKPERIPVKGQGPLREFSSGEKSAYFPIAGLRGSNRFGRRSKRRSIRWTRGASSRKHGHVCWDSRERKSEDA